MKEWKIVIGIPGKIIVGNIKVESKMVDARTHSMLNRKVSSRSASGTELSLTGFMRLTDVTISEHNNKEYQESKKYKDFLVKKDDIFFVYDEDQPKSIAFEDTALPTNDIIQKKTHTFEITTNAAGNSYYQITGVFTGFLKHFEEHDFIQLKNVSIIEFLKREDGFLKLKYDKKSLVSINTKTMETIAEIMETD